MPAQRRRPPPQPPLLLQALLLAEVVGVEAGVGGQRGCAADAGGAVVQAAVGVWVGAPAAAGRVVEVLRAPCAVDAGGAVRWRALLLLLLGRLPAEGGAGGLRPRAGLLPRRRRPGAQHPRAAGRRLHLQVVGRLGVRRGAAACPGLGAAGAAACWRRHAFRGASMRCRRFGRGAPAAGSGRRQPGVAITLIFL